MPIGARRASRTRRTGPGRSSRNSVKPYIVAKSAPLRSGERRAHGLRLDGGAPGEVAGGDRWEMGLGSSVRIHGSSLELGWERGSRPSPTYPPAAIRYAEPRV